MINPQGVIIGSENKLTSELYKTLTEKSLVMKFLHNEEEIDEYLATNETPNYIFVFYDSHIEISKIIDFLHQKKTKTEVIVAYGDETDTLEFEKIDNQNLYIILAGEIEDQILIDTLLKGMFSYGLAQKKTRLGEKIKPRPVEVIEPTPVLIVPEPEPVVTIKSKRPQRRIKLPRINIKRLTFLIFTLVFVASLPILLLIMSSVSLKLGFYGVAKVSSGISKNTFVYFDEGRKISSVINDYSEAFILANESKEIIKNIGKNKIDANKLYLNIDDLNNRVLYILAEEKKIGLRNIFLPTVDLGSISHYLVNMKEVVKEMPQLMGHDSKVNYLILVQDTNELWPTGGKIQKFGIVTIENGQVSQSNFYEPKTIDAQIKGEVVPPLALGRYLGIKNWNFSEANWEGDFRLSAQRAQWFIDKGMEIKTNGVIGVESQFYQKMGNEDDLLRNIFDGLNEKNVLVYFNNEKLGEALSNLNWDGGVSEPKCSNNCLVFYTGMVEANLGGNKIEPSVIRGGNLDIDFSKKDVEAKLKLEIVNSSNEIYKDYVRLLGGDLYKYLTINPKSQAIAEFDWTEKTNIDFSKPGKIIVYIRKQPGVGPVSLNINLKLPAPLTEHTITSYNTNLTADFVKEIVW